MAEFSVIMKQWRRMCNECTTTCNLFDGLCAVMPEMSIQDLSDSDISRIEETVVAWAAEHPEPVYPTWCEWLISIGAVTQKVKPDVASFLIETGLLDPIPADIAQKLGIEPK